MLAIRPASCLAALMLLLLFKTVRSSINNCSTRVVQPKSWESQQDARSPYEIAQQRLMIVANVMNEGTWNKCLEQSEYTALSCAERWWAEIESNEIWKQGYTLESLVIK
jgi:hypothetical protein